MKNTDIEIQLVVGTAREGKGWTRVKMKRFMSGWQGSWHGEIEGRAVYLNLHLPLGGMFDAPPKAIGFVIDNLDKQKEKQ